MPTSTIPPGLIAAYRATDYRVGDTGSGFSFRIEQPSPELARLLAERGVSCAAYMTASNPFSVPQPDEVNAAAHAALLRELAGRSIEAIEGSGRGDEAEEKSVLALGLGLEAARELGEKLRQNAIVWAAADGIAKLILLR
jgi:hypothetical protein